MMLMPSIVLSAFLCSSASRTFTHAQTPPSSSVRMSLMEPNLRGRPYRSKVDSMSWKRKCGGRSLIYGKERERERETEGKKEGRKEGRKQEMEESGDGGCIDLLGRGRGRETRAWGARDPAAA
jgi:hypothetical protein